MWDIGTFDMQLIGWLDRKGTSLYGGINIFGLGACHS
jgi:hypothetical protein